jgi:hypothetical protein
MIEFLWTYFIFVLYIPQFVDRDNVIGIATRFEIDGPGIEFWWGRDFPHLSRTALGSTSPLHNGYQFSLPKVSRPCRGFNHPPPSSTEVKERVQLCLYSPSLSAWWVTG